MNPKIPIAAITDEFSPDLESALAVMEEIGMKAAELRVVNGKNVMDLSDAELDRVGKTLHSRGFAVISIASPLLKCVLPGAPAVDGRFQQDMFNSKHRYEDQPKLAVRAFEIAQRMAAGIVRVFSYWRSIDPDRCLDEIASALHDLAVQGAKRGIIIGLENEHACNIGTATEAAKILDRVKHPNLKLVWDPANAYVAGENPFPGGYALLPRDRIVHVHAKDCEVEGHKPEWGPLGTRAVDWKGQIAALLADRYEGYISLETHWPGPNGDKLEASRICGWNLRGLASG